VERETAVARKQVEDTDTAIKQEQDDMRNAEKVGLTTTKPETTFQDKLNAIGDSLSDLGSSDDEEDREDEDDYEEEPAGGKLSQDDEPAWVIGTFSNMIPHRMERFRQKQMQLDKLTQPGWGDAADYFREIGKEYGMTALKVLAVVQPQMADNAASSVPTTLSEPLETHDSVPGKLQMPQVTSRPRSSHMRLVGRSCRHTNAFRPSRPPQCPIGHQLSNPNMFSP